MDDLISKKFSFISGSLPSDTFHVVAFKGSERLSAPYRFEIVLISSDPEIDFKAVMNKKANPRTP